MFAVTPRTAASISVRAVIAAMLAMKGIDGHAQGGQDEEVSFQRQVAPLLQRRCVTCHGEDSAKGGYRLDTFQRLMQAGDTELPPVVPGKPDESEFYRLLIEQADSERMPQKADRLPDNEIALIERWIRQGASYDGGAESRTLAELTRETMLRPPPEFYPRPAPVTALAFSPDARWLAVNGYREVFLWDNAEQKLARRITGLPERITGIAWHPKKNLLAISGGTPGQWGAVALVDPKAKFEVRILGDLPETVQCLAFSPDGDMLAAGGGDRTIRIFEIPSGREAHVLKQHADWVQSVEFSPDGAHLVTASRDRTARVFRTAGWELEATYSGHEAPLLGATLLPGGKRALSFARGRSVRIWDIANGRERTKVGGVGSDWRQAIAIGRLIVAASDDRQIRVFQNSGRDEVLAFSHLPDVVQTVAIAPDGSTIATGSADGEVRFWTLACGTWTARFTPSPRRSE